VWIVKRESTNVRAAGCARVDSDNDAVFELEGEGRCAVLDVDLAGGLGGGGVVLEKVHGLYILHFPIRNDDDVLQRRCKCMYVCMYSRLHWRRWGGQRQSRVSATRGPESLPWQASLYLVL
jgi:hypothetical protein